MEPNEVHKVTGTVDGIGIGHGESAVPLNSSMRNAAIGRWWLTHVDAGEETAVDVDATLTTDRFDRDIEYTHTTAIDTDILAGFRSVEPREINAQHALVDDPVLSINETDASWGAVSGSETPIEKDFLLYNPNLEPYVLTRMGYEITMNGVPVGAGETDRDVLIEGHSHEEIGLETAIDATTLDEWWVTHLDEDVHGHQVSEFKIEFSAIIELSDGERIELDLDPLTYEDNVGTDIFDEVGDVGVPPDEADEDGTDDRPATNDGDDRTDDDGDQARNDDTDDREDEDDENLLDDDPL